MEHSCIRKPKGCWGIADCPVKPHPRESSPRNTLFKCPEVTLVPHVRQTASVHTVSKAVHLSLAPMTYAIKFMGMKNLIEIPNYNPRNLASSRNSLKCIPCF